MRFVLTQRRIYAMTGTAVIALFIAEVILGSLPVVKSNAALCILVDFSPMLPLFFFVWAMDYYRRRRFELGYRRLVIETRPDITEALELLQHDTHTSSLADTVWHATCITAALVAFNKEGHTVSLEGGIFTVLDGSTPVAQFVLWYPDNGEDDNAGDLGDDDREGDTDSSCRS